MPRDNLLIRTDGDDNSDGQSRGEDSMLEKAPGYAVSQKSFPKGVTTTSQCYIEEEEK
jgi:hypothetical protein